MRTDRSPLKLLALSCGGVLAAVVACTLPSGDFSGHTCSTQTDCPQPYACVVVQPGAVRTCELLASPGTFDAGPDILDGGGVYYCGDVAPLLGTYCVNCHGPTQHNGGNFQLDQYERDGGTAGAKDYADRIKFRAYDTRTMPPPSASRFPSDDERKTLAIWVVGGAPFCDGGTPGPGADAGP